MATVTRRYSKEEFATRGDALYEQLIRSEFEPERNGDFVAIDIDSGDFEIDRSELAALDRLRERRPQAQPWLRKIGFRFAHKFGSLPAKART